MSTSRSSRPPRSDPRARARRARGQRGEEAVASWYRERGWSEVARNWRCREGEIDLVCRRGAVLAIVEVKARAGPGFGTPAEGVTGLKVSRLRRLAAAFLSAHPHKGDIRFDVAEVYLHGGKLDVDVIENAF